MKEDYLVLLYYCYSRIEDPETFREQHHLRCLELNLKGRIIIAEEGLNGTVSGLRADCEQYMADVKADPRFADIEFKVDEVPDHCFSKLHVRVKPEIVHASLHQIDPRKRTGGYVEPEEFRQILRDQPEDTVILDVRSNYEHNVGKFKNAITLDIENFRDFPEKVKELDHLKGKKVITYCTGGIKCEKASAYLLDQGFEDVHQLHGGIIKYGLEAEGEDFEGKCYVFDNRIVKDLNTVNPTTISKCYVTGQPSDRMVNCANPHCNKHIPMSEEGANKYNGCCSEECSKHPDVRPYDGSGYYQKEMNGYNPYRGVKRKKETAE
ncbi:oxygen-dependent tRNA uridine(34) hydroxylase TrhO [Marinoscillum pacificum]|uniref:oxygen-dependent tRNA uridine(34) hydroxylase TrhO n=1 Tax=Marinoscillum pacificum TaxID=392723 RepID=UPI0021582341|nr:rhodanese-related sulfurtransferase [Marinoscillum pacificum]